KIMRCTRGRGRWKKVFWRWIGKEVEEVKKFKYLIWLFDKMVWATVNYGVEVWGWKERVKIERLRGRFLKWVLGVERSRPGYIIREEMQREKLKGKAGIRAWGYERKLEEGQGGELARMCWEEIKVRARRGEALEGREKERGEYYEERGWSVEEIEGMRQGGEPRGEEMVNRGRRLQEEDRWKNIENGWKNE
ncbi:hypothetical protein WN55_03706, partial [Dufourea novaeangliae]